MLVEFTYYMRSTNSIFIFSSQKRSRTKKVERIESQLITSGKNKINFNLYMFDCCYRSDIISYEKKTKYNLKFTNFI